MCPRAKNEFEILQMQHYFKYFNKGKPNGTQTDNLMKI